MVIVWWVCLQKSHFFHKRVWWVLRVLRRTVHLTQWVGSCSAKVWVSFSNLLVFVTKIWIWFLVWAFKSILLWIFWKRNKSSLRFLRRLPSKFFRSFLLFHLLSFDSRQIYHVYIQIFVKLLAAFCRNFVHLCRFSRIKTRGLSCWRRSCNCTILATIELWYVIVSLWEHKISFIQRRTHCGLSFEQSKLAINFNAILANNFRLILDTGSHCCRSEVGFLGIGLILILMEMILRRRWLSESTS